MSKYFYFIISLFYCSLFAQELPPIVKYQSTQYGAGNQNWMISQDKNHFIYFANNEGLLEYNGSVFTLFPSPNETIVRSVKVIDDKIYTGCYMEFGYWKRQATGDLMYQSISKSIKNKILDDEQFWNILDFEQWVVFQSLNRIYIYDTKTAKITIIQPSSTISKSFCTVNGIFFQTLTDGLFEIENGQSKLVSNNKIFLNNRIVNGFDIEGGLLLQTQFNGMYKLINATLSKIVTDVDAELNESNIYSTQLLADGSLVLGTVSAGIYILSKQGKLIYHITQNKGLSNNTALSLFEDFDKNLWIGLDNGINCINLKSPVKSFFDDTGVLGTVYTSILHNNILYIGTNQGLFYKKYNSQNDFKFVEGTKGQVWSLFQYNGTLFCGHDSGTFVIESNVAKNIFKQSGTWKFCSIPGNNKVLLQGNYFGISVLENINGSWFFKSKIKGFNYSTKYFEVSNDLKVYVSHEYKGVFSFQLNAKLQKTSALIQIPLKGKNACLSKFNNCIYYANKEGIFKLNSKTQKFHKERILSAVLEADDYTSGKLIVDSSNKLWMFSKNYIHYFTLSKLNYQLKQNAIPIPAALTNSMLGYENISQLSNSIYLIGTTDGYYTINISDLSFKNYSISISNLAVNELNEKPRNFSFVNNGVFKYNQNNIAFSYTVPEYDKYINAEYQYLLEGFQEQWSEWSSKPTINFKNLPPNEYVFKVRARIANSNLENKAVYKFTISKPWYATTFIKIVYFLLALFMGFYINNTYKNFYSKQEGKLIDENNLLLEIKELENNQQIMKLKNEQLLQDVDSKSRELAVSNMSLINKNELLAIIKDDLKKSNNDNGLNSIKSVISVINKNINQSDSWTAFKEAFDNADKDFLKKIKNEHPLLTPNDLRMCAYLRLNLSSKEIAPLLNISVRSVEIKRYRLRKKMELQHEQGLVEYILNI